MKQSSALLKMRGRTHTVLRATGIRVIRFENRTALEHPEGGLDQLRSALNERLIMYPA